METKLVPGKWCSECFFGKNIDGIIICKKHDSECIPGVTVYKQVPSTNVEMLRTIPDSELAKMLTSLTACSADHGKTYKYAGPSGGSYTFEEAKNIWLEWLKSDIKELDERNEIL